MKSHLYSLGRAAALGAALALFVSVVATRFSLAQGAYGGGQGSDAKAGAKDKKDAGPSEGEQKLAQQLNAAPDPAAKLVVAEELIKKYPKTSFRTQIIQYLASQIVGVQDVAQRITLSENLLRVFPEQDAAQMVNPILINAYLVSNRPDDAFRVAGPWIEKDPSEVGVLINLAGVGIQQANNKNTKFVAQSRQYGLKAIELIEADKRPASMDDAQWQANKGPWRAQLYQTVGFLSLLAGDRADGLAHIQKAITLNPANPNNYAILGNLKNEEYQQIATQYKAMAAGPEQDVMLQKAYATLDEIIDLYAHAVALSEGNAQMQPFHDTLYNDLKSYYAYRHNNSTDGLQQLIDKYKAPSPQ